MIAQGRIHACFSIDGPPKGIDLLVAPGNVKPNHMVDVEPDVDMFADSVVVMAGHQRQDRTK